MKSANLSPSSFALKPLAAAAIILCTPNIQALPTVHGDLPTGVSVGVDAAAGTTTVNQAVDRALVNWQDFSIQAGETVRFVQPTSQSVTLNRVVGENASEIFGVLQANGRVFLINPNGIVFGAGSEVSAGALVASTLDIGDGVNGSESSFVLNLGEADANIVHDGQIDAAQIALIAAQVRTSAGSRLGNMGANSTVHLISAQEVTANLSPDQIAFAVEQGFESAVIEQLGQINSTGGQVFLIAQSDGAQDRPSVINLAGVLQAKELVVSGDTIRLSGVVDVGQQGGHASLTAKTVTQDAAVDLSGRSSLQAEQIDLFHADNKLNSDLQLTASQVELNSTTGLTLSGDVGALRANTVAGLSFGETSAASLNATAGQIAQTGALTVTGEATLTTTSTDPALAQSVALTQANNDFIGAVTVNSNGKAVALSDRNDLTVRATVPALSATAGGVLTLHETSMSTLNATAGQIAQTGALTVTGEATLTTTSTDPALAQSVALTQANNDFIGAVTVNSNGKAVALSDRNDLSIQANTGDLVATAQGNLNIQGNTGELIATANNVSLNTESTNASATAQNNVTAQGAFAELNATSGNALTFGETSAASLNATAGQIAQTGALTVTGEATLTTTSTDPALAQSIALTQANNDFIGAVTVNSNGKAVALSDRNDLSIQANTGDLVATAQGNLNVQGSAGALNATAGQIAQTGALTVTGEATLTTTSTDPALAQSIALTQANNDFIGAVTVNSNGKAVALSDRNDLSIQANTGDLVATAQGNLNIQGNTGVLNATVGGDLTLGEVNTNGVNATAGRIVQTGVLRATGDSSLTSTNTNLLSGIELTNQANDFTGNVHLNSNGTLINLRDRDNLAITAQSGVLNILANGELQLGEVNVAGLNATVGSVQQVGAVTVTGPTSLNATDTSKPANIVLNRADNDFVGDVLVNSNGQAVDLSDQNALNVRGNVGDLSIKTVGALTFGQTTAKSLQVDASTVGQTSEIAVGGTSVVRANSQDVPVNIDLNNANNNFSGSVVLDANGQSVHIRDRNDLIVGKSDGSALTELNVNAGGQVTFTQLEVDRLNVNARSMAQSAGIVVNSSANLQGQGGSIVLDHSNNDFKTEVLVNHSGGVTLNDQNALAVQGQMGSANLTAADQLVLGSIQAGALNARGASVSQTAAIAVAGESLIQATNNGLNNNINLDRLDNAFTGRVFLDSNAENVNLRAGDDLIVGSRVQGLTVSAGNTLTMNGVEARSLQAQANIVNQTGQVLVREDATIQANQLDLQNQNNDFEGVVNLQVTDSATIRDRNNLDVNSSAPVLNATAGGTLTLRDLTVTHLNAAGAQIAQTSALTVTGQSTFTTTSSDPAVAQSIRLDHANNDFVGDVIVNSTGEVVMLNDQNDLSIQANTSNLSATAQRNLNVQGGLGELNATAGNTLTFGEAFASSVNAVAAQIAQTGAMTVSGNSAFLTTSTDPALLQSMQLDQVNNDFMGNVTIHSNDKAVSIADRNDLNLSATASNLNATAGGTLTFRDVSTAELNATAGRIAQTGAIAVSGEATLSTTSADSSPAQGIQLDHANNDFVGKVTVNSLGRAVALNDRNNLSVQATTGDLNVNASNTLTFHETSAGSVNATAARIQQTGAITVAGQSTLTATSTDPDLIQNIELNHENNDFVGNVAVNSNGKAVRLFDRSNLSVQANTGVLSATAQGNLNVRGNATDLNATAGNTLILGETNVGSLNATAAQITQNGALVVSGQTALTSTSTDPALAQSIQLNQANNDFVGVFTVNSNGKAVSVSDRNDLDIQSNTGDLTAIAQGNLNVSGTAVALNAVADNALVLGELNVNRLSAKGNAVTQTADLIVSDLTVLEGARIDLQGGNQFTGAVVLNADQVALNALGTLDLQGQVNDLQAQAGQLVQTGSLQVRGNAQLQASQVALNHANNQFTGAVNLNQVQQGSLRAGGTLVLTGQGNGQLNVQADNVQLGDLGTLAALSATANQIDQVAALNVTGDVTLASPRVNLTHAENDFGGVVNVLAYGAQQPLLQIRDKNNLSLSGQDFTLAARVGGDLLVNAANIDLLASEVTGQSEINLTGALSQSEAIVLNEARINANELSLEAVDNRFLGKLEVNASNAVKIATNGSLDLGVGDSVAPLELAVGANATIGGSKVLFGGSMFQGDLTVQSAQVEQSNPLTIKGNALFNATGGQVVLMHADNVFDGTLSASGDSVQINSAQILQIRDLLVRNAEFISADRIVLLGNIEQNGGVLSFTANASSKPLSVADLRRVLPPSLDVFSRKEAVNPLTGLGRIEISGPAIEQVSGQIRTSAGSQTHFAVPQGGSVFLSGANQINGSVSALSGQSYKSRFNYDSNTGASLVAINNENALQIGGQGIESDLVAIRSRGLSTVDESVIRTRMPYNDIAVGAARSYAGLTLSVPVSVEGAVPVASSNAFGSSASGNGEGQSSSPGAIRVEVGELSRPGLGGYVSVLPIEGARALPGQVIYLTGPENQGRYTFFYDGARNLNHIPVVYNGSLLLSPQETAALTSAQGAVLLAQQEQTRSVVRTENVTGKVIHGVVVEAGPGRPATEGQGGAAKPGSCDADDISGACAP